MVMITCPQCGQHVLDVASSCPKCGHVLMQNPLETGDGARLASCRRCGKHIDRDAVLCPFCGHRVRRSKLMRRGVWGLVVTAAAVGGAAALARTGVLPSLPWKRAAPEPVVEVPAPAQRAPAPDTAATAVPLIVAPPKTAAIGIDSPPQPPVGIRATPAPQAETAPPDLRAKWTAEWANVRAGRTVESAVVRVLAPGRRVEIGDLERGWWALFENGARVGYIANSVLTETPPQA